MTQVYSSKDYNLQRWSLLTATDNHRFFCNTIDFLLFSTKIEQHILLFILGVCFDILLWRSFDDDKPLLSAKSFF